MEKDWWYKCGSSGESSAVARLVLSEFLADKVIFCEFCKNGM